MADGKRIYKIRNLAETVIAVVTAVVIFGTIGWEVFGEEKTREVAKAELKPLEEKVDSNTVQIKKLDGKISDIDFQTKKILLILEKTSSKRVVRDVEREVERFRPEK